MFLGAFGTSTTPPLALHSLRAPVISKTRLIAKISVTVNHVSEMNRSFNHGAAMSTRAGGAGASGEMYVTQYLFIYLFIYLLFICLLLICLFICLFIYLFKLHTLSLRHNVKLFRR